MSTLEQNIRQTLETILPKVQRRHEDSPDDPIILGITGLQGSGKSTWASTLVRLLSQDQELYSITVSLDDFYKTHAELLARRDADPGNKLYRTRGQPGTHDEQLAQAFFRRLKSWTETGDESKPKIPYFDKSKFNGEGDRAPESEWPCISRKPDVIVFEGWCLGFQPVSQSLLEEKHALAKKGKLTVNTPANHDIAHLVEVNDSLKRYCDTFMGPQHFDFFIHIDTEDLENVYTWRLEQEHKLIAAKGQGMSDERVRAFIDGYMPSYEIYLDQLREGLFEEKGKMVRVVLDRERRIQKTEVL
jgi:D-glycerate 3-kinase